MSDDANQSDLIPPFQKKIKELPLYQTYELNTDEKLLRRFLIVAKNDLQKAVDRYETYYKLLISLPKSENFTSANKSDRQWFVDTIKQIDTETKKVSDVPTFAFYQQDKENRAIVCLDASTIEQFLDTVDDYLLVALYGTVFTFDYVLENFDYSVDNGFVLIDDWGALNANMTWHFMKNTWFMRKMGDLTSGAMPIRIKKYFIINAPKMLDTLFNFMSPFMSEKIKSRMVFVHGNEEVEEELGVQSVPVVLGGERKHLDLTKMIDDDELEATILRIFPRKWSVEV